MKDEAEISKASPLQKLFDTSQFPDAFQVRSLYGRTSNGYLEYIYRRAANEMFKVDIKPDEKLNYKQGKNRHYQEVTHSDIPIKFVAAYGFQHIQNIIRKLKTSKCDYDYVELMACPSGCINGGGQIKPEQMVSAIDGKTPDKMELLNALEMSLGSMENKRKLSEQE